MPITSDADKYGALGDQFFSTGKFHRAETAYWRALNIARELGILSDQCLLLGNLGVTYFHLGELEKSIACLREALTIAEKLNDTETQIDLLDKLGVSCHIAGFHKTSIDNLFQALTIADAHSEAGLLSRVHGHLGNVFSSNGAYHKAEPHYRIALDFANQCDDDQLVALWLGNLGNNFLGLQQYSDAVEHFERARQKGVAIDHENESKWRAGLKNAKQRLMREGSVRARGVTIGSSNSPGPFAFEALALRLADIPDIREKIKLVQSQQSSIAETIDDVIRNSSPDHAFGLIDCSKSLISRELLHQKRAKLAGYGAV